MSEDYNGWTGKGNKSSAYATWRVMLEMGFGDRDDWTETFDEKPERADFADYLKDETEVYVDDVLPNDGSQNVIQGWVGAFLDDVSWDEIAENILSDWPEDD